MSYHGTAASLFAGRPSTGRSAWRSCVLLVLFAYLTYGIFSKSFVSYDDVTLQTSKTGLQLPDRAPTSRSAASGSARCSRPTDRAATRST